MNHFFVCKKNGKIISEYKNTVKVGKCDPVLTFFPHIIFLLKKKVLLPLYQFFSLKKKVLSALIYFLCRRRKYFLPLYIFFAEEESTCSCSPPLCSRKNYILPLYIFIAQEESTFSPSIFSSPKKKVYFLPLCIFCAQEESILSPYFWVEEFKMGNIFTYID